LGRLPDAADAELVEFGIEADDWDIEREGLGREDAVERVAVRGGESRGAEGALGVDGEQSVASLIERLQEPGFKRDRFGHFSETHFGRDFPSGCSGDQYLVVLVGDGG